MSALYLLCGFMGCGKSTVGKALAKALDAPFADLDAWIVRTQNRSIASIFETDGEAAFRRMETATLRDLCAQMPDGVIALGGGAMLPEENARLSNAHGTVVFLDVPFAVCYARISGDKTRPIAANASREALCARYAARRPVYLRHAAHTLRLTGKESAQQIAERILKL